MTTDTMTPDANLSFVDRAPGFLRPYLRAMRLDRPIGIWLLLLPCIWGTVVARPHPQPADELYPFWLLFFVGAVVMRSAGCLYNDIIDRKIDQKVERTANRPIANGQVPVAHAWALLVVLSLIGLLVLVQLNQTAILVGLCALALVAAYPFMKRITWWPQAWLGLTFNWGVLVGAAAISGGIPLSALLVYLGGVFWTLGYDTIYAHQDREDDALVGVKSSARRLGENSKIVIALFYSLTLALFASALIIEGAPWIFLALMIPAAFQLGWQIIRLDIHNGERCLMLFKSNVWAGLALALPLLAA